MTKTLFKKLSSQSGETLAETLVSMLIAGLSILMLSTAIAASARIVMGTKRAAQAYKQTTNTLVTGDGSVSGTVSVRGNSSVLGSISSGGTIRVHATIATDDDALPGGTTATTYKRDTE